MMQSIPEIFWALVGSSSLLITYPDDLPGELKSYSFNILELDFFIAILRSCRLTRFCFGGAGGTGFPKKTYNSCFPFGLYPMLLWFGDSSVIVAWIFMLLLTDSIASD